MEKTTVAFIGGGNMARNLVLGLIHAEYEPQQIWVTNRSSDKLTFFRDELGVQTTQDNLAAVQQADVVVIAVEPVQVQAVCEEIKDSFTQRSPLIISVAGGVSSSHLQTWLGEQVAVVRAMPNTPSAVGAGATGLFANANVTTEQRGLAEHIMRSVGIVIWLDDEKLMNTVAAVSGSGPAYIFLIMEAMQTAAEKLGLSQATAQLLTLQTVQGAARMALESEYDLPTLRRFITVPGGSTEQAITVFEAGGLRELFSAALRAAVQHAEKIMESL